MRSFEEWLNATGIDPTYEERTPMEIAYNAGLREGKELVAEVPCSDRVMPEPKSLEHGSTVIVARNESELFYILKWCERVGKDVGGWMYDNGGYPFCISVHGNIVGWTDKMDRALHYKPFAEFLADIAHND